MPSLRVISALITTASVATVAVEQARQPTHGLLRSATFEFAPSDLKLEPFKCSPVGVDGPIRK